MSDNVAITAGSGTTIGADDVSGVLIQRVKTTWGPDGTANDTDVATGKPIPAQIRSATGLIPIGEPTDAKSTATDGTSASLVSIEKQVSASVQSVDAKLPTAVTASGNLKVAIQEQTYGSGAIGATTPRVTLATDSPGIITTGTAGSASSVVLTVQGVASMTPLQVGGDIAHDAVDSGSPQKIGARAKSGLSGITLVAADDRTDLFAGLDGALIVRQVPLPDIVSGNANNTDGTSTEVIAAGGANVKQYLTAVTITNMHATTMAYVELKSATTVKWTCPVPPGGYTFNFNPPLPPNAANEAWNFDPSAAVTTLYCSMVGFKSKV